MGLRWFMGDVEVTDDVTVTITDGGGIVGSFANPIMDGVPITFLYEPVIDSVDHTIIEDIVIESLVRGFLKESVQ